MNVLNRLMGALLPDIIPPKQLKPGTQTSPDYLRKVKGSQVTDNLTNTTNIRRDIFARNAIDIKGVIKNLVLTSPDLSHAVATKLAMVISTSYTVIAKDETGRIDLPATELVQSLCQRLDTATYDYTRFTRPTDFRSLSSALLFDLIRYGDMGAELVLDKGRLPSYIKQFSVQNLKWAEDEPQTYPVFRTPDGDVHLNYPTVFVSTTTRDTTSPYSTSPLQTAIQASLHDMEFMDALRRAASKQMLQRLMVKINSEKFKEGLPFEVQTDQDKYNSYITSTIEAIEDQLNNLQPDDALVMFDSIEADTIGDSNRSDDRTISVLADIISGQISAGSQTLPSIIGRGSGGSDSSSTEAMLFVKSITHIQHELSVFYSRILTLAVRLFGHESFVVFKYKEPDLRPDIETESFKQVKQQRILEQLSYGLISDEEASIELTGTLPPDGYTPLAGTQFTVKKTADQEQNNYSNTSATTSGKPNDTQAGKNTKGK